MDNAAVVSLDGAVLGKGRVGDGVEDVQTTQSGEIWVSYFDEGVFGSDEIASHGCVRWDAAPENGYSVEPAWKLRYAEMADCYTMNTTGCATYLCPYMGFPVIAVDSGQTSVREGVVAGPAALVTDGYRMAVIGSYNRRDDVTLVTLEHETCRVVGRGSWSIPGVDSKAVRLAGRGDRLHGLTGQSSDSGAAWWTCTLDDLWEAGA